MVRRLACLVVLCLLTACTRETAPPAEPAEPLGARSGHSFVIAGAEGGVETVLLAGVRQPEDPAAAALARSLLDGLLTETGPGLRLQDAEAGRDRYDRRIAYAGFQSAEGFVRLDERMVGLGHLMVWPREGADAHVEALLALEREAREAGRGAWGDGTLTVRDPDPDRLAQYLDSAQIVEGRVVSAGRARTGRLYLNFGLDWRGDFTVSLSQEVQAAFVAAGQADPATLEGAIIRVRGWLYEENGPMIALTHPAQLELVDAPQGRALR